MDHSAYTVGWICALPIEMAVAVGMLDERHSGLPQDSRDHNTYTLGKIGPHHVVIACLPAGVPGVTSAARVAEQMRWSFTSLRFGLMVGIGGGVPSDKQDIRLGDVVVSKPINSSEGVIQYDFGKTVQEGRFQRTGSLNKPPAVLLTAVAKVEAQHMVEEPTWSSHLSEMAAKYPLLRATTISPGIQQDQLFEADYDHNVGEASCVNCRSDRLVARPRRDDGRPLDGRPLVHHGLIASGNQVMRDGGTRERLRQELNVLCFEMEAAGLMDEFPCLVIRGICDYADSHKHKQWQPYAAATAAAYAKELLLIMAPGEVAKEAEIRKAITDMSVAVKTMKEVVTLVRSENSMKVMDRLSSVNFWGKQHDVHNRAQKGTGTWILEDPTFKSWLAGQPGILWCRGIPGAGKTVLASIIIDYLVKRFENDSFGLAWIYMDYREHDLQTVENIFADLLRQFIQKGGEVSESIINSFGMSWREGKPNSSEYKNMLQKALQQYSKTVIVIDALDESRTQDLRKVLISELRRLRPAVHLLVTSRPLRDIHDMLGDTCQIEILARNEDVMLYLESHLQGNENLHNLIEADPSLQDVIKAFITQSDDGM
jgi:nucleoside phosphorylase